MTLSKPARLKGNVFLQTDNEQSFAAAQIELLLAVRDCGSISKAAKQVGISYKTAWDRINAMNNLSEQPLVLRSAGGAKGGGTVLTPIGEEVIAGFQALQQEHSQFIEQLDTQVKSLQDVTRFMKQGALKSSARNQFRGEITQLAPGAVNAEVSVRLNQTHTLTAVITNESVHYLGLKIGCEVIALINASWVLLSKDIHLKTSARNQLAGHITDISVGAVNSDVTLDLGDGKSLSAVITNTSVTDLALKEGDQACAFFKASSVILMTDS